MASTPYGIFRSASIEQREKQVNRIENLFTNWSYFAAAFWGKKKNPRESSRGSSLSINPYNEKRLLALPFIHLQKAATCAWLFAPLKGQVCAKGVHADPWKNSKKWPEATFSTRSIPGKAPGDSVVYLMLFCNGRRRKPRLLPHGCGEFFPGRSGRDPDPAK